MLSACCALALRPAGFTSRDLRHYLAPQLGTTPEDMTGGQISYDLRRLRAHQIIERIPHSRSYQVTADGLSIALFLTRLTQRLLIPGPAELTSPGPPGRKPAPPSRPRLPRRPDRPCPAGIPRRPTPPAAITYSNQAPVISRHARRNLTQNSRSLRGKITYQARRGGMVPAAAQGKGLERPPRNIPWPAGTSATRPTGSGPSGPGPRPRPKPPPAGPRPASASTRSARRWCSRSIPGGWPALYSDDMHQITIWATLTDDTPRTVTALLDDPRTDHDAGLVTPDRETFAIRCPPLLGT